MKYHFTDIVDIHQNNGYYRMVLHEQWKDRKPKTANEIMGMDLLDETKLEFIVMAKMTIDYLSNSGSIYYFRGGWLAEARPKELSKS